MPGETKNQNETSKQTDHITDFIHHEKHDDHSVDIPTEPIPQIPELRRSSQIPQPSGSILQSQEYQQ